MNVTVDGIIVACSGVIVVSTVVSLAVRAILVPYLREHLVNPVADVKHQVTVNHHSSEKPTVLDRIDDLSKQIADLRRDIGGVRSEQRIQRQEQADQSERINGMAGRLSHHIDGTPE